jgi:hypothetical protein
VGVGLYFVWTNFIKLFLDWIKLSKIPGPVPVPVLGNLYDKMALTSVRTYRCYGCDGCTGDRGVRWGIGANCTMVMMVVVACRLVSCPCVESSRVDRPISPLSGADNTPTHHSHTHTHTHTRSSSGG